MDVAWQELHKVEPWRDDGCQSCLALLGLLVGLFMLESQPGGGLVFAGKVNASPCSLKNQLAGFI